MKLISTTSQSFVIFSILSVMMGLVTTPTYAAEPAKAAPVDAKASAKTGVPIAQVIWVKGGRISAKLPNEEERVLQRRSVLYEHDSVITAKGATGEISFTDDSVVSLNPESELKIDEYKHKKGGAPQQEKSVMTLVKGGFRTITGSIPKDNPDSYKINTPVATIGVRGTGYATVLSPTKGLLLKIEKGVIDVNNKGGKIELSKCEQNNGSTNCNEYGVVKSFDLAPVTTSVMPAELANLTPLTPVPKGFGAPGSNAGGAAGSSDSPGGGAPAKSVSSFCVGLLKSWYAQFNNLFG
jgi:hypothetical protein